MMCTAHQTLFSKCKMGGAYRTVGRGELQRGMWWEDLTERGHIEAIGINGRIGLKMSLEQ